MICPDGVDNPCQERTREIYSQQRSTGEMIKMTDTTGFPRQLFLFEHDAGRLELLIRIVYWILIGIVLWVYGIVAGICLFVQWFYILVLGRRNQALSDIAKGYLEYLVHVMGYTYIMTDKRPDILPVSVKIYEE